VVSIPLQLIISLHHGIPLLAAHEVAADVLGLALKAVVAFLAAAEHTALLLELRHVDRRQFGSRVEFGRLVMDLVDRDSGVDDVGLDRLLVDYRLDGLVDMMMDVLSGNSGSCALRLGSGVDASLVPETLLLGSKSLLGLAGVPVIEFALLNSPDISLVLLWKHLAVLNGLDGAVVVVLVDFLVDGGVDLLMLVRLDGLVGDAGRYGLVDSGVFLAGLRGEVAELVLDFFHCDWMGVLQRVLGDWQS